MKFETEYTDVNNNLRHYSNLRFAQLTIFSAITGALISFFYSKIETLPSAIKICIEIGGICLAAAFWIMEESATAKWQSFKERAIELEKELDFKQITNMPSPRLFSATNATRVLFIGGILFWIIIIYTYYKCRN